MKGKAKTVPWTDFNDSMISKGLQKFSFVHSLSCALATFQEHKEICFIEPNILIKNKQTTWGITTVFLIPVKFVVQCLSEKLLYSFTVVTRTHLPLLWIPCPSSFLKFILSVRIGKEGGGKKKKKKRQVGLLMLVAGRNFLQPIPVQFHEEEICDCWEYMGRKSKWEELSWKWEGRWQFSDVSWQKI